MTVFWPIMIGSSLLGLPMGYLRMSDVRLIAARDVIVVPAFIGLVLVCRRSLMGVKAPAATFA